MATMQGFAQGWMPSNEAWATYDADTEQACLEAAVAFASSCPQTIPSLRAMLDACASVFVGVRQPGEACESPADCAPPADGVAACDTQVGLCTQFVRTQLGDPCEGTLYPDPISGFTAFGVGDAGSVVTVCDTSQGLLCDLNAAVPECRTLNVLGEACTGTGDCLAGLYCSTVDSRTGAAECKPKAGVGEPCDSSKDVTDLCVDGAFCDDATSACTQTKALGAPCAFGIECQSDNCDQGTGSCADILSNASVCGG